MLARPMPFPAVQVAPNSGLPEINPERGQLQWWVQGTEKLAVVPIAAGGTAEDSFPIKAEKNGGGDFELAFFSSRHLGAYRMQLDVLGGINKRITNGFVHVDFISSVAGAFPLYVSTPLWVEAKTALSVKFQQINTDRANEVELKVHGRRLVDVTEESRKALLQKAYARSEWPMFLGLDDVSVTLTSLQSNFRTRITVPADGDCEIEYLLVKSTGSCAIRIQDQNGRPLMTGGGPATAGGVPQENVNAVHISGSALFPYRMPMGGWLNRQQILDVFVTDLSGASNTVEICLVGRCLNYPMGTGRPGVAEPMDASVRALAVPAIQQNPWEPARQAPPVGGPSWLPNWLKK